MTMAVNKVGIPRLPNTNPHPNTYDGEIKRLKHEISVLQKRIANPVEKTKSEQDLQIEQLNNKVSSYQGIISGLKNRIAAYEDGHQTCRSCNQEYTPRVSKFCKSCRDLDNCKKKKFYKTEFTGQCKLFFYKLLRLVPQKWRLYKCQHCIYWHITSSQNPLWDGTEKIESGAPART
jgi:hypothetical protein